MRHIPKDSIVSWATDSENPNFPVTMVADMHPKRKYKALSGAWSARITLGVVGGCSDIMLAGTNAINAVVSVTDPNEISWADTDTWADGDSWANVPVSVAAAVTQRSRSNAMWLEIIPQVNVPCEVELTAIASPSETLEIGVIRAGLADIYGGRNPRFGIAEDGEDKSIEEENSNGSFYYKKRDVLRVFGLSALFLRNDAWRLADHFDEIGKEPTAWRITDKDESDWVIFASMTVRPSIGHDHQLHSPVNFDLREVI
jgi:hypothetical protein